MTALNSNYLCYDIKIIEGEIFMPINMFIGDK